MIKAYVVTRVCPLRLSFASGRTAGGRALMVHTCAWPGAITTPSFGEDDLAVNPTLGCKRG